MGSTDSPTQTAPKDKPQQHQDHGPDGSVWTNVSQEVNAPGTKAEQAHLASANDSKSLPSGFPADLQITGQESVTATATGGKGDGSSAGDVKISRNHSGDVTTFSENVNGKQVSLMGADGKPLPGLSTDSSDLQSHPPNVQLDPSTGKIKSYDTAAGVTVALGDDGKPASYSGSGFTYEHHNDGWHRQSPSGDSEKVNEPDIRSDGTVHTGERSVWHHGRDLELVGDGERTGEAAADRSQDPAQVIRNDNPKTIDQVLQSLDKLEKALPNDDSLKWFNSLYKMTTQGVKDGIADGTFKDPKFIEQFDVNFANSYLDAVKDHLQGKPMPESWQALLNDRHNPNISPMQFTAAGMMAHITHDLPYALSKTFKDLNINPGYNSQEHDDFETFNGIVKKTLPGAMKMLGHDAIGHLANFTGETGQNMATEAVTVMRDGGWKAAKYIHEGGNKAYYTGKVLDEISADASHQILHPGSFHVPVIGEVHNPLFDLPLKLAHKLEW